MVRTFIRVQNRARGDEAAGMAGKRDIKVLLSRQFGREQPLLSGNGRRPPDRRRVSLRWFFGSVLTGFTSLLLMGGALYAALDGRQQLADPPQILNQLTSRADGRQVERGDRVVTIVALESSREKILQVPTLTRVGEANVIRKKPFAYAEAPLAIVPINKTKYPRFDPLAVFTASRKKREVASSDVIYSANIEGEVTVKSLDFPLDTANYEKAQQISDAQAEMAVREARNSLDLGGTRTAALPYLDPSRFALDDAEIEPVSTLGIKVVEENVSRIPSASEEEGGRPFAEEVVVIGRKQPIRTALAALGATDRSTDDLSKALASELDSADISAGSRIRVSWERSADEAKADLKRVSLYRRGRHLASVAYDDDEQIVVAKPPVAIAAIADSGDDEAQATIARSNLPNIYDGIYRAALSQGLTTSHARRIVRTVAFDVDFRQQIHPKDTLEVFYSIEEGEERASEKSEILYVGLTVRGTKKRYYRFRADSGGSVDYYDREGKSAKKFLIRRPVPNGRFRSKFGMRRHPISGRYKMHTGVDFSAPRGTPIIAAGNGMIEKRGWAGGYGRQIIIRHANGYKTSYNHMHRFARGTEPGRRVRLGQIIGQVGSTGYSTGPHLHYEVIVNGRKVNPMGIRLPKGRVLKGRTLAAFKRERARIDALLERSRSTETTLASL